MSILMVGDILPITLQVITQRMKEFEPFEDQPIIAVALSGGIDSMALTYLLTEWVYNKKGKIIAITVDHGLRAESASEAQLVGAQLLRYGIEHIILRWDNPIKPTSNIQAHARKVRYELLTNWCQENNILHLCIAHNQEDQIETFLNNIDRGSGIDGLSAMYKISYFNNIRIIRPFLNISKASLKHYLEVNNYVWYEDPSNKSDKYQRNRLRKILLAYGGDESLLTKRLNSTIDNMQRVRNSIENSVSREAINAIRIYTEGYARILVEKFLKIDPEESLCLLSRLITTISGNEKRPRFKSINLLRSVIINNKIFNTLTLGNCKISLTRDKNEILVYREAVKHNINTILIDNNSMMWDNRFLVVTNEINGHSDHDITINYLLCEGLSIYMKNQNSLLYNKNMPKSVMATLPALRILDKVVAIPHIDYYEYEWLKNNIKIDFNPVTPLTRMI
ncbi:tRNA(Ile)-lysidine synthase [Rickettsiales bacterium Ac37b]|nr:tRNA(Ile)-lysidine synthase [Rickettsiales bacterium Ac37b]